MNTLRVDLHLHTHFSDGTFSPEEVVQMARQRGLAAIAITDHDITDAIPRAVIAGAKYGVEVIPGIELSSDISKNGAYCELHLLGYYINWENDYLQEKLRIFRQARERRAIHILNKLADLGIRISEERLFEIAGEGAIGRPHFARVMYEDGHVKTISEAFEKYLANGKPADVPKLHLKPSEAIKMILKVGGIPVMAHPTYGGGNRSTFSRLKKSGLLGIEAIHSGHTRRQEETFTKLAKETGLLVTGGSDCHGKMGDRPIRIGSVPVSYEVVFALKKYKNEIDRGHLPDLKAAWME